MLYPLIHPSVHPLSFFHLYLFIYPSIHLSISLSIYHPPTFPHLHSHGNPTSRSHYLYVIDDVAYPAGGRPRGSLGLCDSNLLTFPSTSPCVVFSGYKDEEETEVPSGKEHTSKNQTDPRHSIIHSSMYPSTRPSIHLAIHLKKYILSTFYGPDTVLNRILALFPIIH